ncbi:MAG: AAA family ATPase [Bryobacterales bacterium]|nr:AAA family ATPase [Bryobacterales bacterium]
MTGRRLPIGIQTFRKIREEDYYYVDKTAYLQRLIDRGTHYFLSRPRRFGKSLLLNTLKELFEGNEALFRGLAIHDDWDWSVRYPVLVLSFGGGIFRRDGDLEEEVAHQLETVERDASILPHSVAPSARFRSVIRSLHERTGQRVVVLVDEYDKPILDALEVPEVARANRDFLRGLYGMVKDCDAHVRFAFLAGVTKFSKVSLFSGLNNLADITLDPRYAAVCGYTDTDLDTVFAAEQYGLDRDKIRAWYNGYNWRGAESVYNPFDILLLFDRREFGAWWFETGTPTFLVDTLLARQVSGVDLDAMIASGDLLSSFDVGEIATEALLFQTGYLTITGTEDLGGKTLYRLGYPNREVRQSLNERLLQAMTPKASQQGTREIELYALLRANDFGGLRTLFESFFASIPHDWHRKNDIARYEGYYASVFYAQFAALGLDVTVEDSSIRGRLDMAVRFNCQMYLFEFKVVELARRGTAMAQLRAKDYAGKYRGRGLPMHLIGVEFSREEKNIVAFDVERA